jgi:hypothetical protein
MRTISKTATGHEFKEVGKMTDKYGTVTLLECENCGLKGKERTRNIVHVSNSVPLLDALSCKGNVDR